MRRDPRVHLLDALDAAQAIQDFAAGRTEEDYGNDRLLRSAIDREFEVGERSTVFVATTRPSLSASRTSPRSSGSATS